MTHSEFIDRLVEMQRAAQDADLGALAEQLDVAILIAAVAEHPYAIVSGAGTTDANNNLLH